MITERIYYQKLVCGILSIILLTVCFPGYTETFYINPKGNDLTGIGSLSKPWRTLLYATKTVITPGDIIHVMPGKYMESGTCELSVGVSLEGEGEVSVLMSSLTADWTPIISASSPEGTDGNQHISGLTFDGQNLSTFWAVLVAGRSNFSIYNCIITDFKDRGVIYDGRNDNKPEPPGIYAKGNSFHDNKLTNCAAYNTENGVYGRGCLNIGGQDGMLIYNNIITQNSRPDGYNGWPIKYSNDGYLKGVKIYKNVLEKIPFSGQHGGENGWDFAVELWHIEGGVEIYDNTIRGAIDIVHCSENEYDYGIRIHNNTISRKELNAYFESGIIFEMSTVGAIVENNRFDNISAGILFNAQERTVVENIVIRNNTFSHLGRKGMKGNNGSAINFNCGTLFGSNLQYTVNNIEINNNSFIADRNFAPFYGIDISGQPRVSNVRIMKNRFEQFDVAWLIANPAKEIDSLYIVGNTLKGNGNQNKPLFIRGTPSDYTIENNKKELHESGNNPGLNFRQRIVRPVYYEAKNISILEIIAVFALIFALWFFSRENIYGFPFLSVVLVAIGLLGFEHDAPSQMVLALLFILPCGYGWWMWSRRDPRHHRIVRVARMSAKEMTIAAIVFITLFICFILCIKYFKQYFASGYIPWADALLLSLLFTALLLITRKKVESWPLLIASFAVAVPLFFIKHYLLSSIYSSFFVLIAIWGYYSWRKLSASRLALKLAQSSIAKA